LLERISSVANKNSDIIIFLFILWGALEVQQTISTRGEDEEAARELFRRFVSVCAISVCEVFRGFTRYDCEETESGMS